MTNPSVDYELLEISRTAEIQDELTQQLAQKSGGKIDSLHHAILAYVVGNSYEKAKSELKRYVSEKTNYPDFLARAERYVTHCIDLISAIETKRNFPGMSSLSLSKQQEINEKVLNHFEELKHALRQIEKSEKESKLTDMRSTVWVVRSFVNATFFIMIFLFFLDLYSGMAQSINVVWNAFVDDISNLILGFF